MRPRPSRPGRLLRPVCAAVGVAALVLAAEAGPRPSADTSASRLAPTARAAAAAPPPVQWCGGDLAAADRRPDVLGGNQVHVVYAVPSDGQEQFGAYVHRIVTDLGAIDAWWRRQDPAKTVRFDVAPFNPCASAFGQIDISVARLPHNAAFFAPLDTRIRNLAVDLALVFNDSTKKYLVYYDGPLNPPLDVCGTAFRGPSDRGGAGAVAAVWLRGCVTDVGSGDIQAAVAAHELLHQFGVLPAGAPHRCPNDDGHPCDSPQDLMYPQLSDTFESLVLDVGRDDYYGHSGTWFDAQDSRWLKRADAPATALTVAVRARSPQDRVMSDPVGIECPTTCSVLFDTGSQVRLAAAAGNGSRFLGFTGACTGRSACTVTIDAAKTVEARFGPDAFQLALAVTGQGRVAAPAVGLSCARRCATPVDAETVVRVRATAAKGWRFARWTGSCRGAGACSVRVSANRAVGVVFRRR